MSYWKQVLIMTRWEYSRFFKPKNELAGIIVMLVVSALFYFGGKLALSSQSEKTEITVFDNLDSTLTGLLNADFKINVIPSSSKTAFIDKIATIKDGILLEKEVEQFNLHAYKNNRSIKKLNTVLNEYSKHSAMQKFGISQEALTAVALPAKVVESFIYTDNSKKRITLAIVFAGLMIMAVFLSFAYQFTSITGEKQLKITEQIVSAIRPQVWMDGKIFGITLTGLSSMLTYSILGIVGSMLFFQFSGTPVSSILGFLHLPSMLLFLPFALTGILIWNAILAAIASIITDPNSSGKGSLMMLPLLFVAASFFIIRDPDGSFALFLSWFPLTSATSMPMRWAISEVPFWQLIGSFLILAATFYYLRKLAAKIFRVSILITGKEPSWAEIYKLSKQQ